MEKVIEEAIKPIRKNRAVQAAYLVKEECGNRLERLKVQLVNLSQRVEELQNQLTAAGQEFAELILSGQPESRRASVKARVVDLEAELTGCSTAQEALSQRAIPKAEADLKDAEWKLIEALGPQLDNSRRLMEDEAAKAFDKIAADLRSWDEAVDRLLREMGAWSHDAGLAGGSDRLHLRCASRDFLKWAARGLQSNIPPDQYMEQFTKAG